MAQYKISTTQFKTNVGATSSVEIDPFLSDESRQHFVAADAERLLGFYHRLKSGQDMYTMYTADLEGKPWRVDSSLEQKSATVRDIIESAAIRTTQLLRSAGEIVDLYLNGELAEEVVIQDVSVVPVSVKGTASVIN